MTENEQTSQDKLEEAAVHSMDGADPVETTSTTTGVPPSTTTSRVVTVIRDNEFLVLILAAIALARAYPPLGADYLKPDITATWIAVFLIFIVAGLGLKTEEFNQAFQRLYFNVFVQVFSFGVVSAAVYGLSRALDAANIVSHDLAEGMVVCASLPVSDVCVCVCLGE
jgi:solute carrier family 10 (sodium/bile acid cotransporter), member 7